MSIQYTIIGMTIIAYTFIWNFSSADFSLNGVHVAFWVHRSRNRHTFVRVFLLRFASYSRHSHLLFLRSQPKGEETLVSKVETRQGDVVYHFLIKYDCYGYYQPEYTT